MTKVYINNGHDLLDPGGWHPLYKENHLAIELGKVVAALLEEQHIEYELVPDELKLRKTIGWVNERAGINDTAFSIHFNSNKNSAIRGTEGYYYNDREKELAEIYTRNISNALGIPNRGAKPDRQTWVGSLGWVRKLKCDSVLIEVCYLSSDADMKEYNVGIAATGIVDAIKEILPRKDPVEATSVGRTDADLMNQGLSLLEELILLLTKLRKLLMRSWSQ